ncbi:aldose 1-epimerase [Novosphingobium beihaiensis]|uniref:Aldose 1-epimerase n=1 Tax=Novosphingobium beihaiensis TaxID=2930389 RepID=A0ABT0BQ73_9SPHN|nr:aldose 1-epimerase [Novosphingobium beihaiensis]MCJ2187207.1 aldose 1-epimerase [Novosphingobium beihaiensis]
MRIAAGDWQLDLDPHRGGMIRALTRQGRDILRPMPEGSTEPFESACFPLAPYVNRIAHGRFAWDGTAYTLAPNHEGQAHPLHGTAWLGAWDIEADDAHSVTQVHHHKAGTGWDWPFTLRQALSLSPDGLEARLELHNTGSRAMPVGLGFHPWFARSAVTAIAFEAEAVWLADADMLPTQTAPADALGDWSRGAGLERPDLVDHCYAGWGGALRISRTDGDVLLEGDAAPFLHLYVPPGEDFFCAEPQSTMPDAVNRMPPAPLSPGEMASIAMRIRNV